MVERGRTHPHSSDAPVIPTQVTHPFFCAMLLILFHFINWVIKPLQEDQGFDLLGKNFAIMASGSSGEAMGEANVSLIHPT